MKGILLTGATGALGSMLLPRLIGRGYRVFCLVRQRGRESPHERIARIVDPQRVVVVRGNMERPGCDISLRDTEVLCGGVDRIVHCAASISFDSEEETHRANVEGVKNVLTLATELGVSQFVHVSTTYVAGDAIEFHEHELNVGQQWRNAYERTKYQGEVLVREWGTEYPMRRYTIIRPSILIGCEDGTTPTFDAYYGYFRHVHGIAESMRKRAVSGDLPPHVREKGGIVHLPLVFQASKSATLNLVPIDWVADMMITLLERPVACETYHLVHPHPPLVRAVIEWSLRSLGIAGVEVVESKKEKELFCARLQKPGSILARLQRQVDERSHNRYLPYVTGEPQFSMNITQAALGELFRHPPSIDAAFLDKLLRHAVASNGSLRPLRRSIRSQPTPSASTP